MEVVLAIVGVDITECLLKDLGVSGFRLPPNQNSGCPDDQPNIRAPGDDNQTIEMCWNISKN